MNEFLNILVANLERSLKEKNENLKAKIGCLEKQNVEFETLKQDNEAKNKKGRNLEFSLIFRCISESENSGKGF